MNRISTPVFNSVAVRLTLWYVGMLAVVVAILSIGLYTLVTRNLYDHLDAGIGSTLQLAVTALKSSNYQPGSYSGALTRTLASLQIPNQTVAVLDSGGHVLAEKTGPGGPQLRIPPSPLRPTDAFQFYELPESQPDLDDRFRAAFERVPADAANGFYCVIAGQSSESLQDRIDLLFDVLWTVVPMMLIVAGTGGWFLTRSSLTPVMGMAQCAHRISAANLDQRLPITNAGDEFGSLAAAFNELLARLHGSFTQQQQFMADASHELRTPVSAIRTTSEVLLEREGRSEGEYLEAMNIIKEQSRRLTRIVEDMFTLARADAGHTEVCITELYLDELLLEIARSARMLAARKGLRLEISDLPEARFFGDEGMLRRMLWNLVENAVKYTPQDGRIEVSLSLVDKQYLITVTNSGDGIPEGAQAHIFERFYRADQARSRENSADDSGAGLGLPIARSIAEAHRGRLALRKSDHSGSIFEIILPADAEATHL